MIVGNMLLSSHLVVACQGTFSFLSQLTGHIYFSKPLPPLCLLVCDVGRPRDLRRHCHTPYYVCYVTDFPQTGRVWATVSPSPFFRPSPSPPPPPLPSRYTLSLSLPQKTRALPCSKELWEWRGGAGGDVRDIDVKGGHVWLLAEIMALYVCVYTYTLYM